MESLVVSGDLCGKGFVEKVDIHFMFVDDFGDEFSSTQCLRLVKRCGL